MPTPTLLSAPVIWILLWFVVLLATQVLGQRMSADARDWVTVLRRLLIPYLALITGAVSPRLMGLTMIDWKTSLGLGVGLVAGFSILFALVRMGVSASETTSSQPQRWRSLVHSGTEEFSWAFLRGATWETLLLLSLPVALPAYWATWIAALLALPDLLLHAHGTPARIIRLGTLAATGVTFVYTRNFWLCWMLHAAISLLFAGVTFSRPSPEESAGTA